MSDIQDNKLLDKCLNTSPRYNIPEHIRSKMVNNLVKLMDRPEPNVAIRATQTLVELDKINVDILRTMKPRRSESMVLNVTKLSDQELIEAIKNVEKLLPRTLDIVDERRSSTDDPN